MPRRGSPKSRTSVVNTDVFNSRAVRPAIAVIDARRLRRDAVVVVVQTADFWKGDNATGRRCDRARAWRVLAERQMCA